MYKNQNLNKKGRVCIKDSFKKACLNSPLAGSLCKDSQSRAALLAAPSSNQVRFLGPP